MENLRYLTDHYDEKIERIKKINAPLNFVFITDIHAQRNKGTEGKAYEPSLKQIRSMRYILDRVPNMDFILCGGDVGDECSPEGARLSLVEVREELEALGLPVHRVVGNHDDAIAWAIWKRWKEGNVDTVKYGIAAQEMHELWMQCSDTDKNYYYFDTPQGYRFVLLNTSDKPFTLNAEGQYDMGHVLIMSDEQVEWLKNEALQTDKRVIVVSHASLMNKGVYGSAGGPQFIAQAVPKRNLDMAYQAVKESGNVACMLFGHVHYDNTFYDDRILVVSSQCALMQKWSPSCPDREEGTITETAFDVISIKDDVMYMTRFGAGHDREAHIISHIEC